MYNSIKLMGVLLKSIIKRGQVHMSINIKWDITYKCNLNCKHCVNGDLLGQIDYELDTSEILQIIEKLSHLDIGFVIY